MTGTLATPQKRRHADLLAARDPSPMAQAQAALLRAEADLEDTLAGQDTGTAAECRITVEYPILGRCEYEGGVRVSIEHPWTDAHAQAARAQGLDVAWQWRAGAAAGTRQSALVGIYIGTRETGPLAYWADDGWRRLESNGNYGRRWACGGTWSAELGAYPDLESTNPELAARIAAIQNSVSEGRAA